MNILFVHEIDWKRKPVMDMHMLAETLSVMGNNVTVLSYESMWKKEEQTEYCENIDSRFLQGSEIKLYNPKFVKVPMLSRLSAVASHYTEIPKILKENNIDIIVLYSIPTNGLQILHWSKKLDVPVVFRSIDVLNKIAPINKITGIIIKKIEQTVYRNVDKIMTLSPSLTDYINSYGVDKDKIEVVKMPVDLSVFYPNDEYNYIVREQWDIDRSDKLILFMGTLFKFSGLDTFLSQYDSILRYIPNAKMLIVGDGIQRKELESYIYSLGLQDYVKITGFLPYEQMPMYINSADICVNPFRKEKVTNDIFPGKVTQFLACGKTLVSTNLKGMVMMINDGNGVSYINDPSDATKRVSNLLLDSNMNIAIGFKGLQYVRNNHDTFVVGKQVENTLLGVLKKRYGKN